MSKKKKSVQDRSVKIGRDATDSVIISGNDNVVTIASGSKTPSGSQDGNVPKVFISSTSEDLKPYRDAAHHAAVGAGCLPIQMEYFPASGQHAPLEACMQKVAEADVVVLIVAHRYGWVPEDQEGDDHKSITWLECEQAKRDKNEVLAFLIDEEHPWDSELKEQYRIAAAVSEGTATPEFLTEVQRNVKRLADFKQWIDSTGVRAKFTTPEDLGWKVAEALREWKQRHARPDTQPPGKALVQSAMPAFPAAYREWQQRQCVDIDLVGMRLKEVHPVKLNMSTFR
jgi:hypothetical protein